MARITVEDCIDKFPSRFELVLVASQRARKLHSGDDPTVTKDNDKNTVIALREIADSAITVEQMKENLIQEYQTITISDEEEENLELDVLDSEEESSTLVEDTVSTDSNKNSSADNAEDNEEIIKETLTEKNHGVEIEEELSSLISSEESEIEQQYEITDTLEEDANNSQNLDNESDLVKENLE